MQSLSRQFEYSKGLFRSVQCPFNRIPSNLKVALAKSSFQRKIPYLLRKFNRIEKSKYFFAHYLIHELSRCCLWSEISYKFSYIYSLSNVPGRNQRVKEDIESILASLNKHWKYVNVPSMCLKTNLLGAWNTVHCLKHLNLSPKRTCIDL